MSLLPLETKVCHDGHGLGKIVAYNGTPADAWALKNLTSPEVSGAVKFGLTDALVSSFYGSDRYPYVIKYDSGYQDVYDVDGKVVKVVKE